MKTTATLSVNGKRITTTDAENVKVRLSVLKFTLLNLPTERERLAAELEKAKKAYEDAKASYNRSIENVSAKETKTKAEIEEAEQWLSEYDAQPKVDAAR